MKVDTDSDCDVTLMAGTAAGVLSFAHMLRETLRSKISIASLALNLCSAHGKYKIQ